MLDQNLYVLKYGPSGTICSRKPEETSGTLQYWVGLSPQNCLGMIPWHWIIRGVSVREEGTNTLPSPLRFSTATPPPPQMAVQEGLPR